MLLNKNPFSPLVGGLSGLVRNKYLIVTIVFLVWIAFFDKHSLVTNYQLNQDLEQLEKENADYKEQIAITKAEIEALNKDLEKFAREKYFFQKENEDVFVVVKK